MILAAQGTSPVGPILLICGAVVVVMFALMVLWRIPGNVARSRGNLSVEAINVMAIVGLFFWPLWVAALIWAYCGKARMPEMKRPAGYAGAKSLNYPK